MAIKPKEINEFSDTALLISWDDGHESVYLYNDLRKACPCATCRVARSAKKDAQKNTKKKKKGFRPIPMGTSNTQVAPQSIDEVGFYAVQFKWSDGHNTGIYTFDFLRSLCTCEQCEDGKG